MKQSRAIRTAHHRATIRELARNQEIEIVDKLKQSALSRSFHFTISAWLILALAFLTLCYQRPLAAEQEETERSSLVLDPVLVTARGYQTKASEIPGSVAVIDGEEISSRQPASIPNILDLVPGVSKTSDSAWSSDVNIRGLSRDSVVMLIDGFRVNTSTDINAQYGLIDPLEIESIEILKGPISALYGSGAIGGVVNVITKSGKFSETPEVSGAGSVSGRNNPAGASLFARGNYNNPNYYTYLSQSFRDYDSYEDGNSDEVHNTQYQDYQTTFKTGFKFNQAHSNEFQYQRHQGEEIGIPGSGTAPLPSSADVTYPRVSRDLVSLTHFYRPQDQVLEESNLSVYYQSIDRRARIDNFPEASPVVKLKPQADHETWGSKWMNKLSFGNHKLSVGTDIWQREYEGSRDRELRNGTVITEEPLPESKFLSAGGFAENSWTPTEKWLFSLGGRADHIRVKNEANQTWEDTRETEFNWSAHVGSQYSITENLAAYITTANGYRAATLEERYAFLQLGGGVTKFGDPSLDSERSTLIESGLKWNSDSLAAQISGFYNYLDNLIADQFVNETTIVSANIDSAQIYGFEAQGRWFFSDSFSTYANLAYLRGKDKKTEEDLPDIAPFSGLVGLGYESPEGLWGSLENTFQAAQHNTPELVESAPEWLTVRLRVGYDLIISETAHTFYAGIDNLFDKNYREYLSTSRGAYFNEAGRSLLAGWQVTF